jgi:hypothetical protein
LKRQQLEDAIRELEQLLDEDAAEGELQRWFERNPVVMQTFNYRECLPHPKLVTSDGVVYIPDFLCQRVDGLWEVVEIKRGDTAILRDADRRVTFYADTEKYIAQCHEYASYFDDAAHRAAFRTRYDRDVQQRPTSVLVAGRAGGLDRQRVHEVLSRRTPAISHRTYDDLRNALEFQRLALCEGVEQTEGLSIHLVLVLDPSSGDHPLFIFDIGAEFERNRVSLRVAPEKCLALDVRDRNGTVHTLSVPPSERTFEPGKLFCLSLEVACGVDRGMLLVEINGRYCSEYRLTDLHLDVDPLAIVLGSDLSGEAHSYMRVAEKIVYTKTLSFEDKSHLRDYLYAKYYPCFAVGLQPTAIQCRGHHFLFSESHPRLASAEARASGRRNLVQPDPERQPAFFQGDLDTYLDTSDPTPA